MTAKIELISPVDGRVYVERESADASQVEQALAAAQIAQLDWQRRPLGERAALCSAAVDAMLTMQADIVPELAWQMGRPVRYGAGELRSFAERARHMIAIAPQALAAVEPAPVAGFGRYIKREPLGTVLVVAPWNYPYLTAVNTIIPALMAGNSVILKHATQTLLVGERFAEALRRANLPQGLFHNLLLSHAMTAQIIGSGRVHQVNFTGSVQAGKAIEAAAVGRFIGVGLELGGKDAAIVFEDINIERTVNGIMLMMSFIPSIGALIAIAALGYAYMKGEESGRADSQEAALRAQIETLRADLRITMQAAEQAAAQEAAAEARAANLNERLKTYESATAVPPADSGFTADDVRGLRELTR